MFYLKNGSLINCCNYWVLGCLGDLGCKAHSQTYFYFKNLWNRTQDVHYLSQKFILSNFSKFGQYKECECLPKVQSLSVSNNFNLEQHTSHAFRLITVSRTEKYSQNFSILVHNMSKQVKTQPLDTPLVFHLSGSFVSVCQLLSDSSACCLHEKVI